jgi:hypothetical protein
MIAAAIAAMSSCGTSEPPNPQPPAAVAFPTQVESFTAGRGAGFGQSAMPGVVLGPPMGGSTSTGSTDVVSLGHLGSIVLSFAEPIPHVDGPDFIVYENAFLIGTDGSSFAEPAQVSVSSDGVRFVPFACDVETWVGCAGIQPVLANDTNGLAGDVELGGGDAFELDALEADTSSIQFIRIDDVGEGGPGTSVGFDLDAIATTLVP